MHKFGRVRCGDQVVVSTLEFVLMGRRIVCCCFSGADFDNHVLPTQLTPTIITNNQQVPDVFPAKTLRRLSQFSGF